MVKDGGYNGTIINKQLSPPQNTPALHATPELKQPKSGTWRSLHAYEARTLQARNLSSFRGLNLRKKKKQSSEKFEGQAVCGYHRILAFSTGFPKACKQEGREGNDGNERRAQGVMGSERERLGTKQTEFYSRNQLVWLLSLRRDQRKSKTLDIETGFQVLDTDSTMCLFQKVWPSKNSGINYPDRSKKVGPNIHIQILQTDLSLFHKELHTFERI